MAAAVAQANFIGHSIATHARLFGHPRIDVSNCRIDSHLSTQTLLVFAMLVTRPNEILSRDEIAFSIWPDRTESDARTALRRHLYKLRHVFRPSPKPWFTSSPRTVEWCRSEDTWVDVNEFRRLSLDEATAHLAVTHYTGDFLPSASNEWADTLRESLRRQECSILERLVQRYFAAGDQYATMTWAERLLECDPWRETTVRIVMASRFRLGDRAGALDTYRKFRARLASELEVEPMPDTTALYGSIVNGELVHI